MWQTALYKRKRSLSARDDMSEKKDIKRAAQDVWGRVKALRAERAKSYAAADLEASGKELAALADELKRLAKQKSALSAMPPDAVEPKVRKPKQKKTRPTS